MSEVTLDNPTTTPPTHTWEEAVEWLRSRPEPDWQEFVRQCYYDDPAEAAVARFCASDEWAAICDLLRDWLPGRVLELGAGRGITAVAFACRGCDVTALEPDPSSLVGRGCIARVAVLAPRPIRVLGDWGERIDVADGSIDIAFCRAVLHHARDLSQFCREVARVLRPGGVFLAEREHVIDRPEDLATFQSAHPLHHLYGGEMAYQLKEYVGAMRSAGLRVHRVIPPFHHPVNFIAPMSHSTLRAITGDALRKLRVLPGAVCRWLARREGVRHLYAKSMSWRSRSPGRMYSFLAVKPGGR